MCPECIKKDQEKTRLNNKMVEQRIKDGLPLFTKEGPMGIRGQSNYMFPCEHEKSMDYTRITFGQWGDLGKSISDESKLYTPTLDEFCVGFVYYEYHSWNSSYYPMILGFDERCGFSIGLNGHQGGLGKIEIQYLWKSIERGTLKVKKLDHDDFFELGFEELAIPEDMEGSNYFKLTESGYEYSIWQEEDRYAITIGENDKWGESIVFYGKIRNKFELSKILNQVKWTSETK